MEFNREQMALELTRLCNEISQRIIRIETNISEQHERLLQNIQRLGDPEHWCQVTQNWPKSVCDQIFEYNAESPQANPMEKAMTSINPESHIDCNKPTQTFLDCEIPFQPEFAASQTTHTMTTTTCTMEQPIVYPGLPHSDDLLESTIPDISKVEKLQQKIKSTNSLVIKLFRKQVDRVYKYFYCVKPVILPSGVELHFARACQNRMEKSQRHAGNIYRNTEKCINEIFSGATNSSQLNKCFRKAQKQAQTAANQIFSINSNVSNLLKRCIKLMTKRNYIELFVLESTTPNADHDIRTENFFDSIALGLIENSAFSFSPNWKFRKKIRISHIFFSKSNQAALNSGFYRNNEFLYD